MCTAYSEFFNPCWVAAPNLLRMSVEYTCCAGTELFIAAGQRALPIEGSLMARGPHLTGLACNGFGMSKAKFKFEI
jgi:hypothetical protein